jgi:hypothetical protein
MSKSTKQEFGHLITMVAATYIPRSQITSFQQLDQGSFGLIYSAAYDGSSVAVKQCSTVICIKRAAPITIAG